MGRIVTEIERPSADLLRAFDDLPTAVLADVSHPPVVCGEQIRPVGTASLTGPAVTVRVPPGDNRALHHALTLAESGDVLVVDAGGYTGAGLWGELLSLSARAHGLAGTIVDGAVRDVAELRDLDYPVFTRGVDPSGTTKRRRGAINVPVTCGRRSIRPGSVMVGDDDGAIAIDPSDAPEVVSEGREKLRREQELAQQVKEGDYLFDLLDIDEG
jgi:4-hydroxy-4-methyl-2-oxoglutarate aldolase